MTVAASSAPAAAECLCADDPGLGQVVSTTLPDPGSASFDHVRHERALDSTPANQQEVLVSDPAPAHVILFCGSCSCGCPELFVDHAAAPEQRIVITDDFGQRIQMSVEQLQVIIAEASSGRLAELVSAELVGATAP
jgi:hypothetical protein